MERSTMTNNLTRVGSELPPAEKPEALSLTGMITNHEAAIADTTAVIPVSTDATTHPEKVADTAFPRFVHEYTRSYISLADQKATFTFLAASALLTYVGKHEQSRSVFSSLSYMTAILLLALSAFFAFLVIFPLLKEGAPGLIYWKQVRKVGDASAYTNRIQSLNQTAVAREISLHIHALAGVCDAKYKWLQRAMIFGALGFVAFLISAFTV
jgi:hypothetical protein